MKVFICLMLLAFQAEAASYSFHINNIEGPHSNGPTVKLPEDSKFSPTIVDEEIQNPNKPIPIVQPQKTVQEVKSEEDKAEFPFRFSFMASAAKKSEREKIGGANFSLSYSILKDFALTGFYGAYSGGSRSFGGEMELTPIRITSFGWKDWIEASALFGVTRAQGESSKDFAHLGARVNLNMGPRYGWNISARTNLTDRSIYLNRQVDAGFHVRF